MCCGCPEPQGGAHNTDTGPAHGPAVGSHPAATNTQFICKITKGIAHPPLYLICAKQNFVIIAFISHK